jgi:hypothetical protein
MTMTQSVLLFARNDFPQKLHAMDWSGISFEQEGQCIGLPLSLRNYKAEWVGALESRSRFCPALG